MARGGALGAYRLLLRILPARFREEFGEEMVAVVAEQWARVRVRPGWRPSWRFWWRQGWAVMRVAVTLRLGRRGFPDAREVRELVGRASRDTGGGGMMQGLGRDLRSALRSIAARPTFALLAMATLGLGIGASTAVFGAVHAVLVRALPYADPDGIVVVLHRDLRSGDVGRGLSPANARDLAERSEALRYVGVAEPGQADVMVDGRAEVLRGWQVSRGFLEALGVEPEHGRLFTEDEYGPGADPVILLGHRAWTARFGGDPALVGGTLALEDFEATVVGILPPGFALPDEAGFWTPRTPRPEDELERRADFTMGVGRLADGVGLDRAREELDAIAAELGALHPETNAALGFEPVPLRDHLFGDTRTALLVLLGSVGLVLLIACANVAGLMLARGVRRQREYALRRALGASRARLVRLLGIESAILASGGCVLGVGAALLGVRVIRRLGPDSIPRLAELSVDGAVLAFALAAAAASALLAGTVPALRLSRTGDMAALGDGGRGSTPGRDSLRAGNRIVVAEIAAAIVLAVGAGLLGRSLGTLLERELGFESENRLAVQAFAYDFESVGEREAFMRSVEEEMESIPGVRAVAITSSVPAADDAWAVSSIDLDLPFSIAERAAPPVGQEPTAAIVRVSHDLFDVLGMRVVEGRGFGELDVAAAPPVIVVNESFARRHFGGRSPLGQHLVIGPQPVPREIVGVVADVRPRGYESDPRPEVYFPLAQYGTASLTFVLRTEVDPATVAAAAREALWAVEPGQSIWGTATLDELLGSWTKERRFNLLLLGAFAGVALLLATVGVYGLVSFSVEGRVAELGIRRVLGSDGGSIVALIVREGLRLGALGVGIGLAGAFVLTRFMRGMLWETAPTDPLTLAGVATLMLVVSALASLVPALRAIRADPASVLREE